MTYPEIPATAKGGGGDFKPVSAGLHPAVCVGVIALGIQEGSDQFPKPKEKLHLRWVCLDETVEWEKDGKKQSGPALIGATYTLSLSENSNLRPLLESWRGRPFTDAELERFNVSALAGKPCQLNIAHNSKGGKTYANVMAIVPWPKGVDVPAANIPDVVVYSPAAHDPATFDKLPKWLRETVEKRLADNWTDYEARKHPAPTPDGVQGDAGGYSDDIPFLPCEYRSVA